METSLHRQLKDLYCSDASQLEVAVDGYRIDAVINDLLIEVQCASLAAIRDKVRALVERHDVLIVKPVAARKYLIKRKRKNGKVHSARYSPTRQTALHVFDELVHFVTVFPHPRLTLEVVLTEQEEHRVSKKKRRWRSKDYRVEDRKLVSVLDSFRLQTATDLLGLLPGDLPAPFSTEELARQANIPRWLAQKAAYCLRKTDAVHVVGKRGNALLYQTTQPDRAAA